MTTQDDFQHWLVDMDDALERFVTALPDEIRERLDGSVQSLDVLETWLLARYPSIKAMLEPSESTIVDGIARYIGETIRKSIGGRWNIRLDDPKYAFYGLPELTDFGARSTPACPHSMATASADRRTGHFLRGIVEAMRRRYSSSSAGSA